MKTLNESVRDFLVGATDYRAFRLECVQHVDGPEERLWNRVESACSYFENFPSEMSDQDLRRELIDSLVDRFTPVQTSTTNAVDFIVFQ